MAKRRPGPGRPSKGDRELMATRLPLDVSGGVKALAEARDWSYSETLAELVAIGLNHLAELPPAPTEQEELPLTKAS
jgi:hypothetical protein